MIARIVPITRLRRPTTTWSYIVPRGLKVSVGSLVQIALGPRKVLGIVWELEEKDSQATKPLDAVLTSWPLMRTPLRNHAEWIASTTPTSLATVVSWLLPAALSKPLTPTARKLLEEFIWNPSLGSHSVVLVPGERPHTAAALRKRGQLAELWQEVNPHKELERWLNLQVNAPKTLFGREAALYAPVGSIREITILEPEDIGYSLEQQPGISLIDAARNIAHEYKAELKVQSYLPADATQVLYECPAHDRPLRAHVEITDLRKTSLVSPDVLAVCTSALQTKKEVFLLLNAHDRLKADDTGMLKRLPGIESFRQSLASSLGLLDLPRNILVGTRTELHTITHDIWYGVIVSLDPLLRAERFRDELHGIADICKLLARADNVLVQSYEIQHPLVTALQTGNIPTYLTERVQQRKDLHQPPFASLVTILTTAPEESAEVQRVSQALQKASIGTNWLCGSASNRIWYGKPLTTITLCNPQKDALLASNIRKELGSLKRPWRVRIDRFD